MALGTQWLADLAGCDPLALSEPAGVEAAMREAARAAGASVVRSVFHRFTPGVSGVLVLSESHLAVHTWPEHGAASIDLFTCGDRVDADAALAALAAAFGGRVASVSRVARGQSAKSASSAP